jgi:geranylgeranyl pyrophosphate synthase
MNTTPLSFEEAQQRWSQPVEERVRAGAAAAGLLGEMTRYHLAAGGKRMRALLPMWLCHNLGGRAEDALDLGAGLELLHNATLVHDDLQDGDTHRRGVPTVWARWGSAQAINAGDGMIFQAFACLATAPAGQRALPAVAQALLRVVEGQVMEFQMQLPDGAPACLIPTMAAWQDMAGRKTGALFGACLRAGALAAGADPGPVDELASYGERLGLLFQVQDDYLDLVGDKGRARRGSDLMEGKRSFPVVWAYSHASPSALAPIRGLLARARAERTWQQVDSALQALRSCGALDATALWLRQEAEELAAHRASALLPGWASRVLAPVAHALAVAA